MPALKTYIVEDNLLIRENLIATLEELGPIQVVGVAADEASAVRWLQAADNHADLVIVDIFIKSGSGLGVLRAAAGLPQRRRLIVLSNYASAEMRHRCLDLGAARVFDKSSDIEALIDYCAELAASGPDSARPALLS